MHSDVELDTSGLNCPLPLLRAKKALAAMHKGQVLHVVATDPGSAKDFKVFCRQTGNTLLDFDEQSECFQFYIEKG
jgi:tRNA 2-thiouridine synthesizing protein A